MTPKGRKPELSDEEALEVEYRTNMRSLNGTAQIFLDIMEERRRQDFLKSQGKFPWTCADAAPASMKLAVLAEEFGEVAKEVCDQRWPELREELVQVMAVCFGWVQALDAGK